MLMTHRDQQPLRFEIVDSAILNQRRRHGPYSGKPFGRDPRNKTLLQVPASINLVFGSQPSRDDLQWKMQGIITPDSKRTGKEKKGGSVTEKLATTKLKFGQE